MLKIRLLLRKIQTLLVNNWRILMMKNAKRSDYFYLNLDIWADFQICIIVPLKHIEAYSGIIEVYETMIR